LTSSPADVFNFLSKKYFFHLSFNTAPKNKEAKNFLKEENLFFWSRQNKKEFFSMKIGWKFFHILMKKTVDLLTLISTHSQFNFCFIYE